VYTAVLVSVLLPIVGGLAYLVLLARPPRHLDDPEVSDRVLSSIMGFGTRVWLGSIASMLISRIAPLIMAPLSSVRDLGLYTVASTISDLPLIVALAVQGALFGVNARTANAGQLTATARLTTLAAILGCIAIGASVPFWISPLFGSEFSDATGPTIILLASAIICVPGLMASSGLSAWGRPGLRSIGLAITFVINLGALVVLVPFLGVYGAALTSVVSNLVLTSTMVIFASRVMGVPAGDFVMLRGQDFVRAWSEFSRLVSLVSRRFTRRATGKS
jgi:O-antigen/teichoic acid export membrane protein